MDRILSILITTLGMAGRAAQSLALGTWKIATSDTTKSGVWTVLSALGTGIVFLGNAGLSLLARAFPTARKVVVVGVIGGFRYFKGMFNGNGGAMVQSTRNLLSPLQWFTVAGSIIVGAFLAPLTGAALLIATYVVFFKDADSLPLATLTTDAGGVESLTGVGTGLIINLFNLFGALRATISWIFSQF